MKKKLFGILLTIVIGLSFATINILAEPYPVYVNGPGTGNADVGVNTITDALAYTYTNESSESPTTIKLNADIQENITIGSSRYIVLDLNGYVLKGDGTSSVITNNGTLTIKDSNPNAEHKFTEKSFSSSKDSKTYYYKYWELSNDGSLTNQGGIITGGTGTASGNNDQYRNGGGIYNAATGTLYLTGGTIIGNYVKGPDSGDQSRGGGIYNTGNVVMSGGNISHNCSMGVSGASDASGGGGVFNFGKLILNNGTINTNSSISGGGVTNGDTNDVNNSSIFTMNGGSIKDNYVSSRGAGLWNAGSFVMTGGDITTNSSEDFGGGIHMESSTVSKCSAVITGGNIKCNTAVRGGGIFCSNKYVDGKASLTVGGNVNITGNTVKDQTTASNLYSYYTYKTEEVYNISLNISADVPPVAKDNNDQSKPYMNIGITIAKFKNDYYSTLGTLTTINSTETINSTDYTNHFFSDNPLYEVVNGENNEIIIDYHKHDSITFDKAFPTKGGTLTTGNYVLLENVDLSQGSGKNDITIPAGNTVNICLNGHVLKGTGTGSVISNSGTLTVYDCDSTKDAAKQIKHYFEYNNSGVWSYYGDTKPTDAVIATNFDEIDSNTNYVGVLGGCITGGNNSSDYGGGIINSTSGSVLVVKNGIIIGNNANYGGGISSGPSSSFTMSGGTLVGNSASKGGGIYNRTSSTISGGTILYNFSSDEGGGIYNSSELNITSVIISNNKSRSNNSGYGGGVFNDDSASFNMSGGEIKENHAKSGGGVYNKGTFNVTGGTIKTNTSVIAGSGIYNLNKLYLKDCSIINNISNLEKNGYINKGGVYSYYSSTFSNSKVSIEGKVVITGNYNKTNEDIDVVSNLCLDGNPGLNPITISNNGLSNESSIGVTANQGGAVTSGKFTTNGVDANKQYFFSDNDDYVVQFNNANSGYFELVGKVEAKTGDSIKHYTSISDALNGEDETKPTTIKLLANCIENVTINEGRKITIDLNGYYILGKNVNFPNVINVCEEKNSLPAAELTIVDSNTGGLSHNFEVNSFGLWVLTNKANTKTYEELIDSPAETGDIIEVTGGVITSNNSGDTEDYFRGIYVDEHAKLTLKKGNIIGNGNFGIRNSGTFIMNGGLIAGNYTEDGGAGVDTDEYFEMFGGRITNNISLTAGGGVSNNGYFKMDNGVIFANNAMLAGGVCNQKNVIIGGSSKVYGNSVTLYGNNFVTTNKFTIGDSTDGENGNKILKPTNDMNIGVTLIDPDNYNVIAGTFTSYNSANEAKYFFSDISNYVVKTKQVSSNPIKYEYYLTEVQQVSNASKSYQTVKTCVE